MGIDNCRYVVFVGDFGYQTVDDQRCLGVKARVGLVAKQVARLHGYSASYGSAFLHATAEFVWEFALRLQHIDAIQAEQRPLFALFVAHRREHVERKHHIVQHRHRVKQRCPLEEHTHLAAQQSALLLGHNGDVAAVIKDASRLGPEQCKKRNTR